MNDKIFTSGIKELVIKRIEGERPRSSTGLVDHRVFTGKVNIQAAMDPQSLLWSVRYPGSVPPQPLKQKFTKFSNLKDYLDQYFRKRGLYIAEVIEKEDA